MPGPDLPDLEERLRRLPAALAVEAPAGLAERIVRGGRRRRRLRRAAAAAAVAALVAGAVAATPPRPSWPAATGGPCPSCRGLSWPAATTRWWPGPAGS